MNRIITGSLCAIMWLTFSQPAAASVKIQEISATNGLSAWLVEDHSLPLVTVKLAYEESGAAYDPQGKEGLASFVSQMLDEGAGDMDSLAFHSAMEDKAAHFEVEADEDMFTVGMQTLSQFKTDTLRLLALAVSKPRFEAEAIERMRGSIQSEIRQLEANPSYKASLTWKQQAFANHPYGRPRHGTLASVAAITAQDLHAFADTHFGCSDALVIITGDMTGVEVRDWLASLPSRSCKRGATPIADIKIQGRSDPYRVNDDIPQTVVDGGVAAVNYGDPQYYSLMVLDYILGGDGLTSRLGREIRDKRGLAYTAESHLEEFDHSAYIALHFATRTAQTQTALGVFYDTLKALAQGNISQSELDDAKNFLIDSFPLQIDSQGALADTLVLMRHRNLGKDYLDKRKHLIEAVTLESVNNAAKTFLSPPPLLVMVGQQPSAKAP